MFSTIHYHFEFTLALLDVETNLPTVGEVFLVVISGLLDTPWQMHASTSCLWTLWRVRIFGHQESFPVRLLIHTIFVFTFTYFPCFLRLISFSSYFAMYIFILSLACFHLSIYLLIYTYLPKPSARAGYDTEFNRFEFRVFLLLD